MKPSYVRAADTPPLLLETMGAMLQRIADAHPRRPALVVREQQVRWNYRQFDQQVGTIAAALLGLGLVAGERIGIWAPNRVEWVVLQFAAARAGLILVNINPAYRSYELEYALNQVGCRALVLPRHFKSSDYLAILDQLAPERRSSRPGQLQASRVPELRHLILLDDQPEPGMYLWNELELRVTFEARQRLAELEAGLHPHDAVNIQFTSGTTGTPKGATLSHHNVVNNGYLVGEAMQLSEHDRLCIPVPFYHCFGMVLGNLAAVSHGACMVIPGEGFDPQATLEAVAAERCTALHGVPTMFIAELEHPRFADYDLSSLRTGIMAGSPCPIEVMRRVVSDMHMRDITIAYGMTETSPVSFQSVPADPLSKRVDSVGRVHPHLEVKLIDEHGQIVPRGTPGELCTRGYSVMQGYWGDPQRSREAIDAEGWMHTGDLAVLDDEGYARIVGRLKDLIIRGGENIYPREIEEFLYRHPAIKDVQVFGVSDPRLGEQVCAWVQLRAGCSLSAHELQHYCRQHLAYYKAPHYVRFVDSFPLTITGKVQKYLMRAAMEAELHAPVPTPS